MSEEFSAKSTTTLRTGVSSSLKATGIIYGQDVWHCVLFVIRLVVGLFALGLGIYFLLEKPLQQNALLFNSQLEHEVALELGCGALALGLFFLVMAGWTWSRTVRNLVPALKDPGRKITNKLLQQVVFLDQAIKGNSSDPELANLLTEPRVETWWRDLGMVGFLAGVAFALGFGSLAWSLGGASLYYPLQTVLVSPLEALSIVLLSAGLVFGIWSLVIFFRLVWCLRRVLGCLAWRALDNLATFWLKHRSALRGWYGSSKE